MERGGSVETNGSRTKSKVTRGWREEMAVLRKLCAYSKDRFKVYGRRIIPFIVLVNPGIYTPWFSLFLPSFLPSFFPPSFSLSLSLCLSFSLPSLSITLLAHRRNPAALPLIPFHFTIIFYELSDRASERSRPGLVRSFSETSKPISEALAAISPESLCTLSRSRFSSSVGEITARKVRKDS